MLNQRKGERAMLVKGCNGDWAIIKARWEGFRRGIPPIRPGKYTCFNIIKTPKPNRQLIPQPQESIGRCSIVHLSILHARQTLLT